jgi:hypothetical protein
MLEGNAPSLPHALSARRLAMSLETTERCFLLIMSPAARDPKISFI